MSALPELQRRFQAYLMRADPGLLADVVSTPEASSRERLEVYANAYRARLTEALDTDYPGVHGLLGDDQFLSLAHAYVDARPSAHPSIRWFGAGLAGFLADTEPYAGQPLLAELARFEWCQGEVFDAADAQPATVDELAALPPAEWGSLVVELHPAQRLLDLWWNAPAVWQALDGGNEPPAPQRAPHPLRWVMWRKDLSPHWRSLEVDEAWALEHAANGGDFASLCEGLLEWLDATAVPSRAAGFLRQWLADGLVRGLTTRAGDAAGPFPRAVC